MIQYALVCDNHHGFDAWFRNAQAYEEQAARGILACPTCDSTRVEKALMAPAVARAADEKMALSAGHPEQAKLMAAMRALREKITRDADYVGDRFAEEARRIHYSEVEPHGIYGEATREEASALVEEGIEFMPLPPVPDEHN